MRVDAKQKTGIILLIMLSLHCCPPTARALAPEEVVVIANARADHSLELAEHYMRQRGIPHGHLVRLHTTWDEHCSRQEYDTAIRGPVREALARIGTTARIRCLVTMYGVPLAIRPPESGENGPRARLNEQLRQLRQEETTATGERLGAVKEERQRIEQQLTLEERAGTQAAVDSELALVLTGTYPLQGWLPNPYFIGFRQQETLLKRDEVLMVARLDGPDPATVRRLLADTLQAEREGLRGRACFDARWPKPGEKNLSGYALYDASIHAAAEAIRASGRMAVRLDEREELFQFGECPDTALYSGWYSLGRYVDAFTWARGAIGFHIASSECATLKQKGSQVWCKRMLEQGVAATVGPVYEPYVQGFPLPELFFAALAEGYLGLGESYLVSLPFLSWQMVLIGDPLYQPFAPQEGAPLAPAGPAADRKNRDER